MLTSPSCSDTAGLGPADRAVSSLHPHKTERVVAATNQIPVETSRSGAVLKAHDSLKSRVRCLGNQEDVNLAGTHFVRSRMDLAGSSDEVMSNILIQVPLFSLRQQPPYRYMRA